MREITDSAVDEVKKRSPMNPSEFVINSTLQPYFKLHGSINWFDESSGHPMHVIGGHKDDQIGRHEILKWNREQFEAYLAKPDTRLMVIGYSFGDEHINRALISAAAADRGLRLFIIDPYGVDVLERSPLAAVLTSPTNPMKLQDYVMGASRRPLRNTFNSDPAEYGKVMKFFD